MEEVKKNEASKNEKAEESIDGKKKVSLSEFKMKSFVTKVKVDQMQFLKTAGGWNAIHEKLLKKISNYTFNFFV